MASSDPERKDDAWVPERIQARPEPLEYARGLFQCPQCHGLSDGPGSCRTCLAGLRADREAAAQLVAALQSGAPLMHPALEGEAWRALRRSWALAVRWGSGPSDVGQAAAAELRDAISGDL